MRFYILASFIFVVLIQNPSVVRAQDDSAQNINKLLNNQMIVSRWDHLDDEKNVQQIC